MAQFFTFGKFTIFLFFFREAIVYELIFTANKYIKAFAMEYFYSFFYFYRCMCFKGYIFLNIGITS